MAVYTQVTKQQVSRCLQKYDIGKLIALKGIVQGVENSNFLLHTTAGRYILTLYEKRVNEEELPWYLEFMEYLAEQGVACPIPIKDKNNVSLTKLSGKPAAIVTFLEGEEAKEITPYHCFDLGKAMAKLHQAGTGFKQIRKNHMGFQSWVPLLKKCDGYGYEQWISEIRPILDEITLCWPDPQTIPSGQIHADLFPDNVFFTGSQLTGFIDFYFACTDFLAYDLAIALNAWCFTEDGVCQQDRVDQLFSGYQSVRPLTQAEKHFIHVLTMGAAMRFFLSRLHDWVYTSPEALVTPKNPEAYLCRLRYHRANKVIIDGQ